MAQLKTNMVLLGIGIAEQASGDGVYYCFTARLRPKDVEGDQDNIKRALRDLGRALDTFSLMADVDGASEWIASMTNAAKGPFMLPGGQEYFGSIVMVPSKSVEPDHIARRLRSGLNSAAALLRSTGYYRVSIRYKPEEQLELSGATTDNPEDMEEGADDLPV
jgi:hypothetical protein